MKWFEKGLRFLNLDKGLVNVTSGNVIATIIGTLFWLFLATILPIDKYGELNYYFAIAFLFSSLSMLGLGNTITTLLSKNMAIVSQGNFLILILNCVVLFIVFLFVKDFYAILLLFSITTFTMSQAFWLGSKKYKKYFVSTIAQRSINIPLSLVLYSMMGVDGIMTGYAISLLIFSVPFFTSLKHANLDFQFLRSNFSFIVPSYSLELSATAVRHMDKLIIAPLFGFTVLGIYQISFQFLMFLSIIPLSLFQFLISRESDDAKPNIFIILGITSIITIFFVISIPLLINNFLPHLKDSIQISQLMVFGLFPMTINSMIYSKFFARGKSKPLIIVSGIRVFVLLILLIMLGQTFSLFGLGIAVLTSLCIETLVLVIVSKIRNSTPNTDNKNNHNLK